MRNKQGHGHVLGRQDNQVMLIPVATAGLLCGLLCCLVLAAAWDGGSCAVGVVPGHEPRDSREAASLGCPELTRLVMRADQPPAAAPLLPDEDDATISDMRELLLAACASDSQDTTRAVIDNIPGGGLRKQIFERVGPSGTILHACAMNTTCIECCALFLGEGVNVSALDSDGKTAAQVASTVSMYRALRSGRS
jgi:hypothetical protein